MEEAPRKFFRLKPGGEVRLRFGYIIRCDEVIKNDAGDVTELRCTYDPDTRSGTGSSDRKVKGTIHWASADHALDAEVRLYDRLFTKEDILDDSDGVPWVEHMNKDSFEAVQAKVEPGLAEASPGTVFQFERKGYFAVDTVDSTPGRPVFNRTATLRDTWTKKVNG